MTTPDTRALVDEIIDLYSREFSEYYATVIAITERFPDQINNEIRNAFSHLARVRSATTPNDAKDEADKSKAHLERACRDCLKLCIVEIRDKIKNQLDHALILHEAISPGMKSDYNYILTQRRELIRAESRGEKGLIKSFEKLLEDCIALDQRVFEQYGAVSTTRLSTMMFYLLKDGRAALKNGMSWVIKTITWVGIIVVLIYIGVPKVMHEHGFDDQWKSLVKWRP